MSKTHSLVRAYKQTYYVSGEKTAAKVKDKQQLNRCRNDQFPAIKKKTGVSMVQHSQCQQPIAILLTPGCAYKNEIIGGNLIFPDMQNRRN